jgi:dTDP-4-amino-4,6-dideoxygalactose transaminase
VVAPPIRIPWWSTQLADAEAAAAADAVRERRLSMGESARAFEEEFAAAHEVGHAIATTSGSAALLLAYWAVGLEPGDEVLVPDGTFVATANAAAVRGVGVRLLDLTKDSFTFDPEQIESALTSRTRAVAVVHLNGRPADMQRVLDVAAAHGLRVVEDAAQALYARVDGRFLGTYGDVGCFSLGVTKLITTGQGGVVVTDDAEIAERARRLRDHHRLAESERALQGVGLNLKYSDILASVGRAQLTRLAEHRRIAIEQYELFRSRLAGVPGIELYDYGDTGAFALWNEVWVDDRERLATHLAARGIELRAVHEPLHTAAPYASPQQFPATELHSRRAAYLPSGPAQESAELEEVADAVIEFAEQRAAAAS